MENLYIPCFLCTAANLLETLHCREKNSIGKECGVGVLASEFALAEKTRCVEVFHMGSVWFDFTEPSLTTQVRGGLSRPNLL